MGDDRIASDGEWTDIESGGVRRRQLGAETAGDAIGCSLYEYDPGASGWPRHYHTANEEAIYVLEGSATIELGPDADAHEIRAGDYVALPADERGTHAIEASPEGCRLLAVSTMNEPDVTVYPDRDAVGLFVGAPPGGDSEDRSISRFLDLDAEVEYWE